MSAVIGLVALWGGEEGRQQNIDTALVHALYWLFILHLLWEIFAHQCPKEFGLPRVKAIRRTESVLIVEKSPWLGVGVMAPIYVLENDFERFVCLGEVMNVQMNDLVQIFVRISDQGYVSEEEVWKTLERTDTAMILVKPGPMPGGA